MNTLKWILYIVAFSIIIFAAYSFLSTYLLSKIRVNKWIVLAIAILIFVGFSFLPIAGTFWMYVQSGVVVLLMLWFMDIQKADKDKKNKIKIKPKAKPNRVKNIDKNKEKK